jgi:hypothetical protein
LIERSIHWLGWMSGMPIQALAPCQILSVNLQLTKRWQSDFVSRLQKWHGFSDFVGSRER